MFKLLWHVYINFGKISDEDPIFTTTFSVYMLTSFQFKGVNFLNAAE
jgi:hypothetical protein